MSTPRTRPITPAEAEHNIKSATGWHDLMSDYVTEQSLIEMYAQRLRQNNKDRDWQRLHHNATQRQSRIAAKLFEIERAHKCADCGEWFGAAQMHPIAWVHDVSVIHGRNNEVAQQHVRRHRTALQRCNWCNDITADSSRSDNGKEGSN